MARHRPHNDPETPPPDLVPDTQAEAVTIMVGVLAIVFLAGLGLAGLVCWLWH
jgi:hypothetical protein